ncbi:MAG: rod shape-determining protein MreC [Patescibacteria group bacterium]
MVKRSKVSVVFFVLLILSILLFIFSKAGFLSGPESLLGKITSPIQSITYSAFNFLSNPDSSSEKLREENRILLGKLVEQNKLIRDNNALRDQFEKGGEERMRLLPAKIVGAPSFIPGITDPTTFTLDKGTNDGVKVGDAVVIKNILVGKVISASNYFSKADILTNNSFSVTVKDDRSGGNGVVKGDGGRQMLLDNVLQADDIKTSDILVTKGSQDEAGRGIPPDLIVGRITSVEKKPSEVFQKGKVQSPLDFSNLSAVFIVVN